MGLDLLLRSIEERNELTEEVTGLRMSDKIPETEGLLCFDSSWKLATFLRSCVNVREIWLENVWFKLEHLKVCQNLRFLSLVNCKITDQWRLSPPNIFPRLVSLNLFKSTQTENRGDLTFLTRKAFPALKYLAVEYGIVMPGAPAEDPGMPRYDGLRLLRGDVGKFAGHDGEQQEGKGVAGQLTSLALSINLGPMPTSSFNKLLHLDLRFEGLSPLFNPTMLPKSIVSLSLDFVHNGLPWYSLFEAFFAVLNQVLRSEVTERDEIMENLDDRPSLLAIRLIEFNSKTTLPNLKSILFRGGKKMLAASSIGQLKELESLSLARGFKIIYDLEDMMPNQSGLRLDWLEKREERLEFFQTGKKVRENEHRRKILQREEERA